jgi:hypothetical protein
MILFEFSKIKADFINFFILIIYYVCFFSFWIRNTIWNAGPDPVLDVDPRVSRMRIVNTNTNLIILLNLCAGGGRNRGFVEYLEATGHVTRAHGVPATSVGQLHARLLVPGLEPGYLIQFRCLFCRAATDHAEEGCKFAALPEEALLGHVRYRVGCRAVNHQRPANLFYNQGF